MIVESRVALRGSRAAIWAAIWAAITDIENAPAIIRGIRTIEIVERSSHGLAGLRRREPRILFGDPAAVDRG